MVELYARDGACIRFGEMIETDLGFIPIGRIVNEKIQCNVKSYNLETKEIEWKPIINWFNNGVTTDWIRLKAKTNRKFRSLTATPNHNILTLEGYKQAKDIYCGDTIFTQSYDITEDQKQIILGSLLGDGSLTKGDSQQAKYKYSETHSIKQKEYLLWKRDNLNFLDWRTEEFLSRYDKKHQPTEKIRIYSNAEIIFEDFYNLKYPELKIEMIEQLNELGLAIWVQDDGYYNQDSYSISCGKTPLDTLYEIATTLYSKFGIIFKVREGNKENLLEVGREDGRKLKELIKPYIHTSMSYKIGEGENKIKEINKDYSIKIYPVKIYSREELNEYDARYDIEVQDNHNFFAQGLLVSNSFLKEVDKFGFEIGYWQYSYQIPAHPMWFNKDEVCYISRNQRSMSCYGFAPTQSILDIVKSLHYSLLYNKRFFEENSIPDGVLSVLDTNETELKNFISNWQRDFKAQPHKFAVLNKAIQWQPFTITQRELEFLETQSWYYKMVISAFGLTPTELGITEDVNRATSNNQSELSRRKGIRPLLKILEKYFNEEIISEFGYEGIEFTFIYDDPSEKNQRLTNWKLEIDMGVKTVNEIRNEMGLEPVEWGELPMSSLGRIVSSPIEENNPKQEEKYQINQKREEGKNEEKPVEKGKKLIMDTDDLISEHEKLVRILEQGNPNELKEEAKHQKNELNDYKRQAEKGIDDGQYYREPSYEIENRGKITQPQNENTCPHCGKNTLNLEVDLDSLVGEAKRYRCINCNSYFTQEELDKEVLNSLSNTLMANNSTEPVTNPTWSPKSCQNCSNEQKPLNKGDVDMETKDFCGFDYSKSYEQISAYINSKEYEKLLDKYLSDLTKKKRDKIKEIIYLGMKDGLTIREISNRINKIIKDEERSELISRTEVIRVANEGQIKKFEEKGVEKVIWLSAPEDGRLCNKCKKLDRKIFLTKNIKGKIPLHCRCRCSVSEYIEV